MIKKAINELLLDSYILPFDIIEKNMVILYSFYKKNPCNQLYQIDYNNVSDAQTFTTLDDFSSLAKKFGLILGYSNLIKKIEYNLLILGADDLSSDNLGSIIEQKKQKNNVEWFTHCAVEKDYSEDEELAKADFELLCDYLKNAEFLNVGLQKQKREHIAFDIRMDRPANYNYVDVSDLLTELPFNAISYDDACNRLYDICDLLCEKYQGKKDSILTIDSISEDKTITIPQKDRYRRIFAALAAYLSNYYDIQFETSSCLTYFFDYLSQLHARRYMYLEDYLDSLLNFPDVSVKFRLSGDSNVKEAYFCLLNHKLLNHTDYQIIIDVYSVPFDSNKKTFEQKELSREYFYLDDIKLLSLRKLYHLNSQDWDLASKGMRINSLIKNFETYVHKSEESLRHITFECTNVFLFETDGVLKIGYMNNLEGRLPFYLIPLADGYPSFEMDFSCKDLCNLFSITIFNNFDRILENFVSQKLVQKDRTKFTKLDYSKGVLLASMELDKYSGVPTKNNKFTFEELGIWSNYSSAVRCGYDEFLTKELSREFLRNSNFYSFYGGPHPGYRVTLHIKTEDWR